MNCTHTVGIMVARLSKTEAVFRCKSCGKTYRAKTAG